MPPSRDTVVSTVLAYVDGVNAADAPVLAALFAEDTRHHEPIGGTPRRGPELLAFFEAAVGPELRVRPVGPVTVHEGHAVVQLEVTFGVMDPFVTTDIFEVDESGLITYFAAIPDLEATVTGA